MISLALRKAGTLSVTRSTNGSNPGSAGRTLRSSPSVGAFGVGMAQAALDAAVAYT